MRSKFILVTLFIFGFFTLQYSWSQAAAYQLLPESKVKIDGTSTFHDWSAKVVDSEGKVTFSEGVFSNTLETGAIAESASMKFKVETIAAGRGAIMDNKIKNAFKYEENPYIVFTATEAAKVTKVNDDGSFVVLINGNLNMAGFSKAVDLELTGKKLDAGQIHFEGSETMKMTTFGIEPPTAMFGQLETGDEVTIVFDLLFSK
ncbi:MAG: YceI family protein [Bacteroidetes bacterium]|nr:YceI family protein [Bacteroidota bacterium]